MGNHFNAIGFPVENSAMGEFINRIVSLFRNDTAVPVALRHSRSGLVQCISVGSGLGIVVSAENKKAGLEVVDVDPVGWAKKCCSVQVKRTFDSYSGLGVDEIACCWTACPGPVFRLQVVDWMRGVSVLEAEKTISVRIIGLLEDGCCVLPESHKVQSRTIDHIDRLRRWSEGLGRDNLGESVREFETGFMRFFWPAYAMGGDDARASLRGPVVDSWQARNVLSDDEVVFLEVDVIGAPSGEGVITVVGSMDDLAGYRSECYFEGTVWLEGLVTSPEDWMA